MTADLADALVPIAAELVGTIRDYGPEDTAEILARVPDGRLDALAVVLAAMVDPDRTPAELLAWTRVTVPARPQRGPRFAREHGSLRGYRQHTAADPACGPCRAAHAEDKARRRSGVAA